MTSIYDNKILFEAISELQIIESSKLQEALSEAEEKKKALGDVLLDKDLITDENFGRLLSDILRVPLVKLAGLSIEEQVLRIIPEQVARKQQMVVFGKDSSGLKIAMVNPKNSEPAMLVGNKTGLPVSIYLVTARDLEAALGYYKSDLQQAYENLLNQEGGKNPPISKLVNLLTEYAYADRASDIHIEPEKKQSLVRFRIDGVLHDVLNLPMQIYEQVVANIKVSARLRTDEHLSAQDGKMQISLPAEDLDIRVSIVPVVHGEKVVLRLLSSKSRQLSLSDLGLTDSDFKRLTDGFEKPYGMVLVTGPTGSGKTTTVYTILKILNVREINIASIEDPVEYDIQGVNQIQVNTKTNLTFATGLRAILRQDPNVIFVGEIRDSETSDIAVNSAMTGHLVLSTLHTNDAATTLPRLFDLGVEPFLVASTVNVIVGQRLVRKLCDRCRLSVEVDREELNKNFPVELVNKHAPGDGKVRVYTGKGCEVCSKTGYNGRIGIFETLVVSDEIKELINARSDARVIKDRATKEGMTTMLEDGIVKVLHGHTSIEEVVRATSE